MRVMRKKGRNAEKAVRPPLFFLYFTQYPKNSTPFKRTSFTISLVSE